ncbi:MAG: hypothetical protein HC902_06355 [Calothrix sp. SM1_5_4]|nr:hypothetical protein [Calothrix sp. SM1_5_4]
MIRTQEKELAQLAESWGVDYQVIKVKSDLIQAIKDYCLKKKSVNANLPPSYLACLKTAYRKSLPAR